VNDSLKRAGLFAAALLIASAANALDYRLDTVAEGLNYPWGLTELPDGTLLITERPGNLKHIAADGKVTQISNVPAVFFAENGQSGLFDVLPDPGFTNNGIVYLAYAEGNRQSNATTVARDPEQIQQGI
jgi:glucose/arabinose dehydrogenase